MKLTWTSETGAQVVAEKPDETLKRYLIAKFKEAYDTEFQGFMEEVAVAMRKLKPGESVVVESRPLKVTLERPSFEDPDKDSQ